MTATELSGHIVYLRACGRRGLADALQAALEGHTITRQERNRLLINAAYLDRQGYATRGAALRDLANSYDGPEGSTRLTPKVDR